MRISKTIVDEVSPECPICKRISTKQKATRERILYDLHFGHCNIKRWVVKYLFHTVFMLAVSSYFWVGKAFSKEVKFGWNLVAYFVYQVIELCIPNVSQPRF